MNFYDEMLKHVKATSTYQLGGIRIDLTGNNRGGQNETTKLGAFTSVSGRVGSKPTEHDAKGPTLQSFGTKISQAKKDLRRISLNDMNHDKRHISARFWGKKRQQFPIFFPADTSTSSHMHIPSPRLRSLTQVDPTSPKGGALDLYWKKACHHGETCFINMGSHGKSMTRFECQKICKG